MKILISHDGSPAHYFDRIGMARAFEYAGHETKIWDIKSESAFDCFNSFEPHLFLGQTYNCDRATIKCIQNRPWLRIGLRAGEWGNHTNNWTKEQKEKYPILLASKKEKEEILRLRDECGKPDFVYIHYHPDFLSETHTNWIKEGINVVSLMNAADLFDYTNGQWREEFMSDLCFIGGAWPYKYQTLESYLIPLCNPNLNLKIRIFGNGWSIPQHHGLAPQEIVKHLLKSAAVCPNVHELHSQDFGYDVIERPFKLASNKCFIVSDYVDGLERIYGDSIEYGKTPVEFKEKILYYLKNPQQKMVKIAKAYKITLDNHTYFDRVSTVFKNLEMDWEVDSVKKAKEHYIKRLSI